MYFEGGFTNRIQRKGTPQTNSTKDDCQSQKIGCAKKTSRNGVALKKLLDRDALLH